MRTAAAILLAALAFPAAAAAQEADGWDAATVDGAVTASVSYEGGAGLMVQCRDGGLDVVLQGLPPATGSDQRKLQIGSDPAALEDATWRASDDPTAALSGAPAKRARSFRRGGAFIVRAEGANGAPGRRLDIALPSDSSALDQVLQACGEPLVDPRDDLPDAGELLVRDGDWGIRHFHLSARGQGRVEVSCIIATAGHVRDCQIETETPRGEGLGAQILRQERRVRFNFGANAQAAEGRLLHVIVTSFVAPGRTTRR